MSSDTRVKGCVIAKEYTNYGASDSRILNEDSSVYKDVIDLKVNKGLDLDLDVVIGVSVAKAVKRDANIIAKDPNRDVVIENISALNTNNVVM